MLATTCILHNTKTIWEAKYTVVLLFQLHISHSSRGNRKVLERMVCFLSNNFLCDNSFIFSKSFCRRMPSLLTLFDTKLRKCFFGRYEGLSDKFLSCPVQKILLLAGTDRLDRFVISQYENFPILLSMAITFAQSLISSLKSLLYSILCYVSLALEWQNVVSTWVAKVRQLRFISCWSEKIGTSNQAITVKAKKIMNFLPAFVTRTFG